MKIRAIITGATGMVGKGVLFECLDSPDVEAVLVVSRHPLVMRHEKLKEIIHKDFFDLSAIEDELKGYNACYFCLGVSAVGLSEEKYTSLTYDLTTNFAKAVLKMNPQDMTFCYVSGAGTDSSEKGRAMWARIKGKTENIILNMGFKDSYAFRPGFIQPQRGIRSKTWWYNAAYVIVKPLYPVLKHFPGIITTTSALGKAMINAAQHGYEKKILDSGDINKLAEMQ